MRHIRAKDLPHGNLFGVFIGKIGAHGKEAQKRNQHGQHGEEFHQSERSSLRFQLLVVEVADKAVGPGRLFHSILFQAILFVGLPDGLVVGFVLSGGPDQQAVGVAELLAAGHYDGPVEIGFPGGCRTGGEVVYDAADELRLRTVHIHHSDKCGRRIRCSRSAESRFAHPKRIHQRMTEVLLNLQPQQAEIRRVAKNHRHIHVVLLIHLDSLEHEYVPGQSPSHAHPGDEREFPDFIEKQLCHVIIRRRILYVI